MDALVVLDGAHLITSDDPEAILNRMVRAAPKYGMGLVLAT
jgi:hypothetical protein